MQLFTYRSAANDIHFGCRLGDQLLSLDEAIPLVAPSVPRWDVTSSLDALFRAGPRAFEASYAAVQAARDGDTRLMDLLTPLESVQLMAPISRPGKIVAVGRNYADHTHESGLGESALPRIFAKFPSAVIGPTEVIVRPSIVRQLDWEVELGVVMGRPTRNVRESEALSAVAGYTLVNDVSARDIQFAYPEQLTLAKSYRTFAPIGPGIVSADELPDPATIELRLWVNGELMQNGRVEDMIWSVPELVAFVSRVVDLDPGDILSTGTPSGVGFSRQPPKFLQPGDSVRMAMGDLFEMSNTVVAQDAAYESQAFASDLQLAQRSREQ